MMIVLLVMTIELFLELFLSVVVGEVVTMSVVSVTDVLVEIRVRTIMR